MGYSVGFWNTGTYVKETEMKGVSTKDFYTYKYTSRRFTVYKTNKMSNVERFCYLGLLMPHDKNDTRTM